VMPCTTAITMICSIVMAPRRAACPVRVQVLYEALAPRDSFWNE
jgi:hypothetical protein